MKASLSRTHLLREVRKMRFEEAYEGWQERRLTQEEAGRLLGMSERNFRRYVGRYEADGLQGLIDRRVEQISSRRAPVDEVMRLVNLYQSRHDGWNGRHLHDPGDRAPDPEQRRSGGRGAELDRDFNSGLNPARGGSGRSTRQIPASPPVRWQG